jgi:hypothetical protein
MKKRLPWLKERHLSIKISLTLINSVLSSLAPMKHVGTIIFLILQAPKMVLKELTHKVVKIGPD